MSAFEDIRLDLVSFIEKFFFNLSFFTLRKMRETRSTFAYSSDLVN